MKKYLMRAVWLAIIGGLISFGLTFTATPDALAAHDLLDKPWVDHVPRSDREPFRAVLFFDQQDPRGQQIGLYLRAESAYKATLEAFAHKIDAKEINILFLHDSVRAVTAYKFERIKPVGDDLDLKLTLAKDPRNNGQQTVYYSSTAWTGQPDFIKHALHPETP